MSKFFRLRLTEHEVRFLVYALKVTRENAEQQRKDRDQLEQRVRDLKQEWRLHGDYAVFQKYKEEKQRLARAQLDSMTFYNIAQSTLPLSRRFDAVTKGHKLHSANQTWNLAQLFNSKP